MISIILYGRNDAHGYNLHKRGALSLNCLAEVLHDDDDEILFVDYNTPDELPTFPQAISDTLTEQCKRRLRIIRVRPGFHAQFAASTRLLALECQSRNIAARRANPANRWILSTNTDMIFCPRAAPSLGGAVAQLDDGFYHLPRFEVPEGFWERLSRTDPKTAIDTMQRLGQRFHLNEIVYGFYDNLYEGPGDFQLFLRDDYFAVCGFDERMILGWHADANMARRMRLFRGKVSTAFDKVLGYHCGHTRQATALHTGVRIENSQLTFVRDVSEARIEAQAESWGAPDVEFEEVRLDTADRYFEALSSAVPKPGPDFSEAVLSEATYHKVSYTADHVLPHLCDLLYNLPAGQTYFYFGDDVGLANGVGRFLQAIGREPRILAGQGGPSDPARWDAALKVEFLPLAAAIEAAEVFIVQHPSSDTGDAHLRGGLEWWCHQVLGLIAESDRLRPVAARRRVIVVNAVHNGMSLAVETELAPTTMPFSTRLRQGYVADQRPLSELDVSLETWRAEMSAAIDGLLTGTPPVGWQSLAGEIAKIPPGELAAAFGLSDADTQRIVGLAHDALADALSRSVEDPVRVGPRADIGNRLCSAQDWLDPRWMQWTKKSFGLQPGESARQTRWMWERISLLDSLSRQVPSDIGGMLKGGEPTSILLVGEAPDLMAALLTAAGYRTTYATADDLLADTVVDASQWADWVMPRWLSIPPLHQPWSPLADRTYDAVVMTRSTLLDQGYDYTERLLARARGLMKPSALLLGAMTVQLDGAVSEGALSFQEWASLFDEDGPLGSRGFKPASGFDHRPPIDTVARFETGDGQDLIPGLSSIRGASLFTTAVVSATWPARLRPGSRDRLQQKPASGERALCLRLGRKAPFGRDDQMLLSGVIDGLRAGIPPPGWQRLAPEVAAIAASADSWPLYGLSRGDAEAIEAASTQVMRAALARCATKPVGAPAAAATASRLCSGLDWEDPAWLSIARRLFSSDVSTLAQRKPWVWERVSLTANLLDQRARNPVDRVLLVSSGADPLAHLLCHFGFDVTCATLAEIVDGADEAAAWRDLFDQAWLKSNGVMRTWTERHATKSYDAVVSTQQSLVDLPVDRLDKAMSAIDELARPGANLHSTFAVCIDDQVLDHALSLAEWQQIHSRGGPLGSRGFARQGKADDRLRMDTPIRFSPEGDESTVTGLSWGYGGSFVTVAIASAVWPRRLRLGSTKRLAKVRRERFDSAVLPLPYTADV